MKTIFIARHASTKAARPNQEDTERPLTQKGQAEAQWLGQIIKTVPSLSEITTSSAVRARETSLFVQESLDKKVKINAIPKLYLAPSQLILKFINHLPNSTETLLLIGHNPGLSQFLLDISGPKSNPTAVQRIYRGLPPAGLATLESQSSSWSDITKENTKLLNILHPGE